MDELNKITSGIINLTSNPLIPINTHNQSINQPTKLEKQKASEQELSKVLNILNMVPIISDNLRFSYASEEHQLLVQIRDKKTDELIRQYPSEEFLARLRYYRDNIGVIFDQKV